MTTEAEKIKEEIEKQAKEDFNKALCQDNFTNADDVFEKGLLDLLQRAERKQYTPNFLAIQGVIYWRCIVQYFRKLYDEEIKKAELKGFQAGENSKHKSDLQQELEFLEDLNNNEMIGEEDGNETLAIKKILQRINLIKKELKEIK